MYKGKFDQKGKSGSSVQELLAQRNSNAQKKPPVTRDPSRDMPAHAPVKDTKAAAPKAPAQTPKAPVQPAKAAPAKASQPVQKQPAKPQKKGPRIGSIIFYTLYFMFILFFFLGVFLGLNWLKGWLGDFEASQPTVAAERVFTQLFTDPDWGALYEAAGAQDSPYEGKEEFVDYMEAKAGGQTLTYLETSAGLSGNKKYNVRMGDEKVATFTLVDKNNAENLSLDTLSDISSAIADWQLGGVEVFFERENSFRIVKVNGHRAFVNDVELGDDFTIQIATTKAEEYLPAGTTMPSMCTQEITGLFTVPTVTIYDDTGKETEVTYDEATRTFTERTSSNTITPEQEEVVIEAAKTNCLWMIEEIKDRAKVAKVFDSSSDAYNDIVKTRELWMQDHNGYEFTDVTVSDFAQYGDSLFSARISLNLNVTRKDGTVNTWPYARSMFFRKNDKGNWLCNVATNIDVTQAVGKVRLTFMMDETELLSNFFETDAKELVTPSLSLPEGKVFAGWFRKDVDDAGVTTMTLVFPPEESGHVTIPEGTTLEPMTLYAYFEDAAAAAEGGA